MADMTKFRRKNLPAPPSADEVPGNLSAPETAPIDGRSLGKTDRTYPFATRVKRSWHDELRLYAAENRLKMAEVLEHALEALKEKKQQEGLRQDR